MPGGDRGAHRATDVGADHRAQRAGAVAARLGVPGDDARWPAEALGQPAGDEPDDALVPGVRAEQQHRDVGTLGDHRFGLRQRLLEHLLLERAPLLVQVVEQHRDAGRLRLVLAGQQARAQRRIADAPAGVDARAEDEAEVIRRRRLVQPRRVVQRLETFVAAPAHHQQPLRDVGAVEAGERHHVGDGRQRDEVEFGHQIGLGGAGAVEAATAQLARVATSTRKQTPAAHRWPRPDTSSWRLGLTTATARGSSSSAW